VLAVVTVALLVVVAVTVWPLIAPLVLGAWFAHLLRPLFLRLSRIFRGRQKAAAILTALLVILALVPVVLAVTSLVPAVRSLVDQLKGANGGRGVLAALVSSGGAQDVDVVGMIKEHGASASKAAAVVAAASVDILVAGFVFLAVFFTALVSGERAFAWFEEHSPLEPAVFRRFAAAFHQAGRGMLVGSGLTALLQGVVATIIYAALGVPRAILFGLLSTVAALIPTTGAAIVWVPIAAGLAFSGQTGKAALLAALCAGVVGTVDNVLRPWISGRAHVGLPASVLFVSIFGGLAVFGGWGILIGPLVVRLAREALEIARERGVFHTAPRRGSSAG